MSFLKHIALAATGLCLSANVAAQKPTVQDYLLGTTVEQSEQAGDGFWYPVLDEEFLASVKTKRVTDISHPTEVSIDYDSLPFELAIVRVRGTGEREIAVVVDPNCPVCQRLEHELLKLDDITIYTFVADILNRDRSIIDAVHCGKDNAERATIYERYKMGGVPAPSETCTTNRPDRIKEAFKGFKNIDRLTPTVIFDFNAFVTSYMDSEEINDFLIRFGD